MIHTIISFIKKGNFWKAIKLLLFVLQMMATITKNDFDDNLIIFFTKQVDKLSKDFSLEERNVLSVLISKSKMKSIKDLKVIFSPVGTLNIKHDKFRAVFSGRTKHVHIKKNGSS